MPSSAHSSPAFLLVVWVLKKNERLGMDRYISPLRSSQPDNTAIALAHISVDLLSPALLTQLIHFGAGK